MALMLVGRGHVAGDSTAAPQPAGPPEWTTPERAVRRKSPPVRRSRTRPTTTARPGPDASGPLSAPSAGCAWRRGARPPSSISNGSCGPRKSTKSTFTPGKLDGLPAQGTGSARRGAARRRQRGRRRDPAGRTLGVGSPIPGKLRILWSPDHSRLVRDEGPLPRHGNEATLARCSGGGLWVATDEGAIWNWRADYGSSVSDPGWPCNGLAGYAGTGWFRAWRRIRRATRIIRRAAPFLLFRL